MHLAYAAEFFVSPISGPPDNLRIYESAFQLNVRALSVPAAVAGW
jgi:hypothetical protein